MLHDFKDTIDYELSHDGLNYSHIGRSNDTIDIGNCSDGTKNWNETGIDCGGRCITNDPEVCNGIDDNNNCIIDEGVECILTFMYGHYYVIVNSTLLQNAQDYVADINDIGYPVMVDVLGFEPEIDVYISNFTLKGFAGGWYAGLRTVDNITGGYIALWDNPLKNPKPYPLNMCYNLLYETIHGFTAPLKYNITTYAIRHQVINRGEDFDIIFELEVLDRLNATECVNTIYNVFYGHPSFPWFAIYYDVRSNYSWDPIEEFLIVLNGMNSTTHVNTNDDECYYLSIIIGEDISPIYEAHGFQISQETKDRIKQFLEKIEFNISLTKGWNLISIPLNLTNHSVDNVFSGKNITIFGYNNSWFVPKEIDYKLGYWIKVNESFNIALTGIEVGDKSIELNENWNLIGYPYLTEKNVSELYENFTIYSYNATWSSYIPNRTFNSLQTLEPGYGYWVNNIV